MTSVDWHALVAPTSVLALVLIVPGGADPQPQAEQEGIADLLAGRFQWTISEPLLAPSQPPDDTYYSVKDPSVVFHEGRWHLFCTVRGRDRSHQIEYVSFTDWEEANAGRRQMLTVTDDYFCAPQVFYFAPQRRWYLICQASDEAWEPDYGAAYSTTSDISDPSSWSRLQPLGARQADGKSGLDFWVICDEVKAHLFFTTLDGRMWREETPLSEFPAGWSEPALAIRGDIFEASHVYRLEGLQRYLTVVEAQGGHGWRYYKAYLAEHLDGEWIPVAATKETSFASMSNTRPAGARWTDCISHGELLRAGCDQRMEVDPANLRFLFQGVTDRERAGKPYGEIPWRLGMLEPAQSRGQAAEPRG
ncbi:MAG: non-reducing end alpha-L-arabinofuranosidase family hydrolase [Armatimonadota bacterium]